MFRKILIANRGEIAMRVIRTLRDRGIPSVAVYSQADASSLHARFADEAVCIGPAPSRESYMNAPAILSAARVTGADAIHPGYGFLAEDPAFAELCASLGVRFVGPDAVNLRRFADKPASKRRAVEAGVRTLEAVPAPGDESEALRLARAMGFPLMLKASYGGGGRGMKEIWGEEEFLHKLRLARAEAKMSCGSDEIFAERLVANAHHIEVQVAADAEGNVVALGERDCSVQRRHQKIVEEAPSAALDEGSRREVHEMAERIIRGTGYTGLATVEFLWSAGLGFHFLEVNPRLQVEHPVTEMVAGLDLVDLQITLAGGERLPFGVEAATIKAHSVECRVNAEDPVRFHPSKGKIAGFHLPGGVGVRVDSGVYDGFVVTGDYDSLLFKVITWGETRQQAVRRMQRALGETIVEGIATNLPFLLRIVHNENFVMGTYNLGLTQEMGREPGAL